MSSVTVQCLGSGDAFGSGGRYQTCYYVESNSVSFLIDCGATSMTAMKRFGVDPGRIGIVLISHLHGDHFGGLPFLIRETQIMAERTRPLIVAGPKGIEKSVYETLNVFFPGATDQERSFELSFIELSVRRQPVAVGPLRVTSYPVRHREQTIPQALRVEVEDKIVSYSGDSEWTESLLDVSKLADLFICEAYTYEKEKKAHLSYRDIETHYNELTCKRLLLTHMSDEMLAHIQDIDIEGAVDGKRWLL